jgi:uncharacterized phage infection (PIP) family protein YhgE
MNTEIPTQVAATENTAAPQTKPKFIWSAKALHSAVAARCFSIMQHVSVNAATPPEEVGNALRAAYDDFATRLKNHEPLDESDWLNAVMQSYVLNAHVNDPELTFDAIVDLFAIPMLILDANSNGEAKVFLDGVDIKRRADKNPEAANGVIAKLQTNVADLTELNRVLGGELKAAQDKLKAVESSVLTQQLKAAQARIAQLEATPRAAAPVKGNDIATRDRQLVETMRNECINILKLRGASERLKGVPDSQSEINRFTNKANERSQNVLELFMRETGLLRRDQDRFGNSINRRRDTREPRQQQTQRPAERAPRRNNAPRNEDEALHQLARLAEQLSPEILQMLASRASLTVSQARQVAEDVTTEDREANAEAASLCAVNNDCLVLTPVEVSQAAHAVV